MQVLFELAGAGVVVVVTEPRKNQVVLTPTSSYFYLLKGKLILWGNEQCTQLKYLLIGSYLFIG